MRHRSLKSVIYSGAGRIEVASSAALILLAAFLKGDPAKQPLPAWLAGPAAWLFANGPYAILALTMISGLSKLLRQRMTRPSLQEEVRWTLDHLQRLLFRNEHGKGDPGHLHRVTLFRLQTRFLHGGQWLVPFARSGHTTQKTDTVFRVDDDPGKVEGVAGRAWAQGRSAVSVERLPDLSDALKTQAPETRARLIAEYAAKTFVSPSWVQRRLERGKMAARSYTGFPVEVGGRIWGSLVIDSVSPRAKLRPEHQRMCALFTVLLGKRLEGG